MQCLGCASSLPFHAASFCKKHQRGERATRHSACVHCRKISDTRSLTLCGKFVNARPTFEILPSTACEGFVRIKIGHAPLVFRSPFWRRRPSRFSHFDPHKASALRSREQLSDGIPCANPQQHMRRKRAFSVTMKTARRRRIPQDMLLSKIVAMLNKRQGYERQSHTGEGGKDTTLPLRGLDVSVSSHCYVACPGRHFSLSVLRS